MDLARLGETIFLTAYTGVLLLVSLYGLHRYGLIYLFFRHRRDVPQPAGRFDELPRVTVQLPMYNEAQVAQRVIEQACRLDYPREKLQIQVLDDSADETCQIARQAVNDAAAAGFDIQYIRRDGRTGYKAGALANGLKTASGEFITIFDADFLPLPDFLQRSIPYFTDPSVCVVQTRWDHLNRDHSILTRSQAILLDGHFVVEHVARNRSKRFMSFNGTAGTWRRQAIEAAGGWQHDTLTEDLDLSYRAQLKGWKFVFLPDLTAPAELPPEMNAFKAQQFRWTKGGMQTAMKILPRVMLSKAPFKVKVEAFFHLTCFSMHLYMLAMVLMMFPAVLMRGASTGGMDLWRGLFDVGVFVLATLSAGVFYATSQHELFGDWRSAMKYMPMMMALGVGLCVSNTKAILEAMVGSRSEFVRTPKYGQAGRPAQAGRSAGPRRRFRLAYVEFALGLYMTGSAVVSVFTDGTLLTTPFLLLFAFGFFYVSVMSFLADRATAPAMAGGPAAVGVEAA